MIRPRCIKIEEQLGSLFWQWFSICGTLLTRWTRQAVRWSGRRRIRDGALGADCGGIAFARLGALRSDSCYVANLRSDPPPREASGSPREQGSLRGGAAAVAWPEIVSGLERANGESWETFVNRHGDWGRDAALWLGRRSGRLRLAQLGDSAGGLDYAVVSKTISRFTHRLADDAALREQLASIQSELSK